MTTTSSRGSSLPRFESFLRLARRTQREVYGTDPQSLSGTDWADYVTRHLHCAHVELGEAAQELPLKPWRGEVGRPTPAMIHAAAIEIVDTLCHVSNVLLALGIDDDDLNGIYAVKVAHTRDRDGETPAKLTVVREETTS